MGVCLDTCHIFAAGYPLGTDGSTNRRFDDFDDVIGIERVRALHLNDSKKELGSRVDRHEHIGEGVVGTGAVPLCPQRPAIRQLPMYLETKKEERDGEQMDAVNLRTLRD